jgi:hypothetical protein
MRHSQSCHDAKYSVAPRRTAPITTAETNLVIADYLTSFVRLKGSGFALLPWL